MRTLPDILPIFPLNGVLLLPGGQLPLNVFEPHYLTMIEDALKASRMIGIIQPQSQSSPHLFPVGCAGRITSFCEIDNGERFEIILTGISRFSINEELSPNHGYRRIEPDWKQYSQDTKRRPEDCLDIDRKRLYGLLKSFFELHELSCSWESIEASPDSKLITALSMICPLDPSEKQCLLEAKDCVQRAEMFMTMLDLAIRSTCSSCRDGNKEKH